MVPLPSTLTIKTINNHFIAFSACHLHFYSSRSKQRNKRPDDLQTLPKAFAIRTTISRFSLLVEPLTGQISRLSKCAP